MIVERNSDIDAEKLFFLLFSFNKLIAAARKHISIFHARQTIKNFHKNHLAQCNAACKGLRVAFDFSREMYLFSYILFYFLMKIVWKKIVKFNYNMD